MQTLSLSLKSRGEEGEPLPAVFQQLDTLGVQVRRGWLTLIAGAPGGGKSALASFLALNMDYTGFGDRVPTLYFSPDNDRMTFGKAALAPAMASHVNDAEERLTEGDDEAYGLLDETTDHLWVSFQAAPTPADINDEINAFAAVYGDWPHLVVIDNLMDVDGSSGGFGDEKGTHDGILHFLKIKARETGAAMLVLAHVIGAFTDGTDIIPRSALMNKIDKRPQLILTLHQASDNLLGVSVVKHRAGRAKSDGTYLTYVPWLPEMAWMGTEATSASL